MSNPVPRQSSSDADARLPVRVGTTVWALVLVVLTVRRGDLAAAGHTWWIGTAMVGVVSGLLGLVFLAGRQRRGRTEV